MAQKKMLIGIEVVINYDQPDDLKDALKSMKKITGVSYGTLGFEIKTTGKVKRVLDWISVNDPKRKPEDGKTYAVWWHGHLMTATYTKPDTNRLIEREASWCNENGETTTGAVTHFAEIINPRGFVEKYV